MADPETVLAVTKAVAPIFDNLMKAYVESKRIDAELEAVRAKAEVEHHRLDVQEKALELQHKENMRRIDEQAKILDKKLDIHKTQIEANIELQKYYCKELNRINDAILDKETPEETRDKFIDLYDRVSQRIENITMGHIQTSIALIQHADLPCLGTGRKSSKKQLSTLEED